MAFFALSSPQRLRKYSDVDNFGILISSTQVVGLIKAKGSLVTMLKQVMDQVGIDFEGHRGAQFHQGKRTSSTIRFAMIPLLLQTVKIDSLFHCN